MSLWLRTLFQNRFFQVIAGIFVTVIIGGLILQWLEPGEISEGNTPFWWAIVTMTTVGYGDFSPKTVEGRLFAVIIMFIGISLVSLLTASISSIFVAQKIREDKGLEKLSLSDHLVLCGWNPNAESVIDSIQNLNHDNLIRDLVLVNDLSPEEVTLLKNRYQKLNIHFVSGDFTHEETLNKASIADANTVIIVPNGTTAEMASHDEKTIFATLTIKSISSAIRVVAYILHRENLTHIKRAAADEVVVSDDYSAHLLASHVIEPGIPQTVNQLMESDSHARIKRVPIPQKFIGQSYDELFDYYKKEKSAILIGICSEDENLGIGAVLSSDASTLDAFIERKLKEGGISLQEESKVHVHINPQTNYMIKDDEQAIIIP